MKSANPEISVIMPVYNNEPYVALAIESILNQTFSNFEFIIIDDCSSDKSAEIISNYLGDPRIIFIQNKKRLKLSKNLNNGIEISQGKYIARMDGDDISDSERFETQIQFLEHNPKIILLGTSGIEINSKGEITREINRPSNDWEIRAKMMEYNLFLHGSVMIRKESLLKTNLYNEENIRCEDYALWLEMLKMGKVAILPDKLYEWRVYPNERNDNNSNMALQMETHDKVLNKVLRSKKYRYERFLYAITKLIRKVKGK